MPVGIQNPDTAKSLPAAMPIPGQIDFEQLRVGPSIEMSLRKTWTSILADACEESGATVRASSLLQSSPSGSPWLCHLLLFVGGVRARATPAGHQKADTAQHTKPQQNIYGHWPSKARLEPLSSFLLN
jgi:hypothetical protein